MNWSDYPREEEKFNQWLVSEYLKYGSVDEVFRIHRFGIPISYAGYQRVLDRWGIVKAAGPNNKLAEVINFLTHLIEQEVPLEVLYKKMPPSFKTSAATLYRVLSYIKQGVTRRMGTGLVITPFDDQKKILVGRDVSTPRLEFGKPFGSISLPIGFSRKRDPRETAILRILQQEVFTDYAIKNQIPDIIPTRPKPFMFLDMADLRVEVFHIKLPKKFSGVKKFSSFKLCDYRFLSLDQIINKKSKFNFRAGLKEIALGFQKYLDLLERNFDVNPIYEKSKINSQLVGEVSLVRD